MMKTILIHKDAARAATWSTSSFGSAADTSPMELATLGEHLHQCISQRDTLFPLKSAAETLSRLVAPRFVTIIVLFAMLIILASWVL